MKLSLHDRSGYDSGQSHVKGRQGLTEEGKPRQVIVNAWSTERPVTRPELFAQLYLLTRSLSPGWCPDHGQKKIVWLPPCPHHDLLRVDIHLAPRVSPRVPGWPGVPDYSIPLLCFRLSEKELQWITYRHGLLDPDEPIVQSFRRIREEYGQTAHVSFPVKATASSWTVRPR